MGSATLYLNQPLRFAIGLLLVFGSVACAPEAGQATVTGYAEAEYLYIAAPSSGWLTELAVEPGQRVEPEQLLFRLDAEEQQWLQEQAEQQWQQRAATAANLASGSRPEEVAVLEALLNEAQAREHLARDDAQRLRALVSTGAVSAAEAEAAEEGWKAAQASVEAAAANVAVARMGARTPLQQAAAADTAAAAAQLAQRQWQTQQRSVHSRQAGQVEMTLFQPGEYVSGQQPVVVVRPQTHGVKLVFFLPQAALSRLQPGQTLQFRDDAHSQVATAVVRRIATEAEYRPPVLFDASQRDHLVYRVEAWPERADLRAGQPVDVLLP